MGTPWDARTYDRRASLSRHGRRRCSRGSRASRRTRPCWTSAAGPGASPRRCWRSCRRAVCSRWTRRQTWCALARTRLGDRAEVWCQDVLDLDLDAPVDAIVSTATLHWVTDHDRLWPTLARALGPAARSRSSAAARGTSTGVREAIERGRPRGRPRAGRLVAVGLRRTRGDRARLQRAGFTTIRCWLEDRPTDPEDVDAFVRTSILPAHLARLPADRREPFAAAVVAGVRLPLDYVRLNVSATR